MRNRMIYLAGLLVVASQIVGCESYLTSGTLPCPWPDGWFSTGLPDVICIPPDENDILITGDFNANRFDDKLEQFWDEMENSGWDVLGDNGSSYPATRLSGHPLKLNKSKIDYIIVTKGGQGLAGEEVLADQATVHTGLVGQDPVSFRRHASDHIPVTVRVRVMDDTDQ